MAKTRRLELVFNPVSGPGGLEAGLEVLELVKRILREEFDEFGVCETKPDLGCYDIVTKLLSDDLERVKGEDATSRKREQWTLVVSGGDGSIHEAVSAMRRFEKKLNSSEQELYVMPRLGVIPRGTGNAVALALGIPTDPTAACALICTSHTRTLDVAHVSFPGQLDDDRSENDPSQDRYCILLAGVGREAIMTREATRELKSKIGVLAYGWGIFKACVDDAEKFEVKLILDNVHDAMKFSSRRKGTVVDIDRLTVTNMKAMGVTISNLAPISSVMSAGIGDIVPDDGLLECVCFAPETRLDGIRAMFSMMMSGLFNVRLLRPEVFGLRAKKVVLNCNPPKQVVLDGELLGKTPMQLECEAKTVEIIAPPKKEVNTPMRKFRNMMRKIQGAVAISVVIAASSTAESVCRV
ncbi:Uncharacterized protein FVE85_4832 [Porphyridium purpureum]|uniref:DAGKc domain-containing protein n=1 Tax=Porphyridium purpureum TaxID=35688 RepID=A0A5J4YR13_PORPP|nr:Uncharacterized protein FVE85_4832 [Porphyridium purpureum]|eukprot:POR1065..scf236_6